MADEQQQDVEISSEENITTTTIEEDELELSLSLRPLNYSFNNPKNLLESSTPASNGQILSKRDAQALRRHQAKLKRDLKRKASSSAKNDVVAFQQEDFPEPCRKVPNLGFQAAAPPWLGWNAGCVNGGFRPYQGQNGKLVEVKDGASLSSGSSSGISDNYHSISGAGGNSSDAGSHSSHPNTQSPPPSVASSSITSQLQPCSSQLDLLYNGSSESLSKPQLCCSYVDKIELVSGPRPPSKSPEGAASSNTTCQQNKAPMNNDKDTNTTPRNTNPKEVKGETGKPPKPVGQMGKQKLLFSQMPCVSTTGNGPNGKTITGFLYKYTKAEVSIICVCHGASFSPAGFVEHAGGVDVEHPLRNIRVVPFALG